MKIQQKPDFHMINCRFELCLHNSVSCRKSQLISHNFLIKSLQIQAQILYKVIFVDRAKKIRSAFAVKFVTVSSAVAQLNQSERK